MLEFRVDLAVIEVNQQVRVETCKFEYLTARSYEKSSDLSRIKLQKKLIGVESGLLITYDLFV